VFYAMAGEPAGSQILEPVLTLTLTLSTGLPATYKLHIVITFIVSLVPRPLIQRMYRLQYNARDTESDPRWGWFGSGTETNS